jgi:hypothetical protein
VIRAHASYVLLVFFSGDWLICSSVMILGEYQSATDHLCDQNQWQNSFCVCSNTCSNTTFSLAQLYFHNFMVLDRNKDMMFFRSSDLKGCLHLLGDATSAALILFVAQHIASSLVFCAALSTQHN